MDEIEKTREELEDLARRLLIAKMGEEYFHRCAIKHWSRLSLEQLITAEVLSKLNPPVEEEEYF